MNKAGATHRSPAKINWYLRVLRRREDGFHEIESLVSAVSLYDEISFAARRDARIELSCDVPAVPVNEHNLVVRAATLLGKGSFGVTCQLTKRIPVGGGLGGGSSNAATTLLALNELWQLGYSKNQLASLAAELGSDVPLFLVGSTVVMAGRGDRVRAVKLNWRGWVVLMFPGFSVSTAQVYHAWRPGEQPQAGSLADDVDRGGELNANSTLEWMSRTFNMLERPLFEVCPRMADLVHAARDLAERPVRVSGSGSTLFTAFDTRDEAERFSQRAENSLKVSCRLVRPVEHTIDEQDNFVSGQLRAEECRRAGGRMPHVKNHA